MKDYKQLILDALDLYKYESDVLDSLNQMRRKWADEFDCLADENLEELVIPYLSKEHEIGMLALCQELGLFGIAIYDISEDEDIFDLVAITTAGMNDFESWCKSNGQCFKLLKQKEKRYGEKAIREKKVATIPLEETVIDDEDKYYIIQQIAGCFAHAICYDKESHQKICHVFLDLQKQPFSIIEIKDKDNIGNFCYLDKHDSYIATFTKKNGFLRSVAIGHSPYDFANWDMPASPGFDPSVKITIHDDSISIADKWHVTLLDYIYSSWEETNFIVDSNSKEYKIGFDGRGRAFFTNTNSILFSYKDGKAAQHIFRMAGNDDISNSIPLNGTPNILLSRYDSAGILNWDMDSGRCHLLPLSNMEWNASISMFQDPWILIKGNGEDLKLDFAKLLNMDTGEILRLSPGVIKENKLQCIAALPDGRYVITYRSKKGQIIGLTNDIFDFLRKNTKVGNAYWLPYFTPYPNISSELPKLKKEECIILNEDSLTIFGKTITKPFRYEDFSVLLGRSRILEHKSGLSIVWEDLGLEGFLSDDETRIERLVIATGPSERHHIRTKFFSFPLFIGDKYYMDVQYNVIDKVIDTINYGCFSIQLSLPKDIEDLSENNRQLHKMYLGAIEIKLEQATIGTSKITKQPIDENKYQLNKIDGEILSFTSFNFKLAIIEVLMYEKKLLNPIFDAYEYAALYKKRKINIEDEGYHVIQEMKLYFKKLEIPRYLAKEVDGIDMLGAEIYNQIFPFWDGEDDTFAIDEISIDELMQFENLRRMEFRTTKPDIVVPLLEKMDIDVELF